MAWTTPKIDSIPADGLDNVHLNKIEDNLKFLAGGTDTIAQSTSAATANALIKRDANGRAKVADPASNDDIATKGSAIDSIGLLAMPIFPAAGDYTTVDYPLGTILLGYRGGSVAPNIGVSVVVKTNSGTQQYFFVDTTPGGGTTYTLLGTWVSRGAYLAIINPAGSQANAVLIQRIA